jgi:DNA repair exonuclease SbcCD ATPase subunit
LPLFRKKKTIWQTKELESYSNKIESQIPPIYPVDATDSVHQTLDAIIRQHWEKLHPLEQDFIFSWFIEYEKIREMSNKSEVELDSVNQLMATTQQSAEGKIAELKKTIQELTTEMTNLKNALSQKMQLADDLTTAIHDKKLSVGELKQKLENRINEMKTQMIGQQREFEANQINLGNQFEQKVLELDEEKLIQTEKIEKNKARIEQFEQENNELKQKFRLLKQFQEKIKLLKELIGSIPENLLEGGGV